MRHAFGLGSTVRNISNFNRGHFLKTWYLDLSRHAEKIRKMPDPIDEKSCTPTPSQKRSTETEITLRCIAKRNKRKEMGFVHGVSESGFPKELSE
jgi:hypothetical protein